MVNADLFSRLVPLHSLLHGDRGTLAKQSSVLSYRAGQVAFTRGELVRNQAYLISGEIELQSEQTSTIVRATGEQARHPLAPGSKRTATALCLKPTQILFVDRDLLDLLLTWSQTGGAESRLGVTDKHDESRLGVTNQHDQSRLGVTNQHDQSRLGVTDKYDESRSEVRPLIESPTEDDANDWMTSLLQSKAFLRVPPGNIAQIFASMEAVSFSPGQTIIQQGAPGDYYYVVTDGRVQVVLRDRDGVTEEELAQLGVGKAFGEEALVSGAPRNASVRALTRCTLMRLSSTAFMRLLRAPLLQEMALAERSEKQQLIDVRLPEEFEHGHLPGAINVPLARVRDAVKTLDPKHEYLVYCDTGRRSASATFLLNERGLNAKVVRGGVPIEELTLPSAESN
jgi:CRP-like cAMP-binding protein